MLTLIFYWPLRKCNTLWRALILQRSTPLWVPTMKKIKRLIYPIFIFLALTTRLFDIPWVFCVPQCKLEMNCKQFRTHCTVFPTDYSHQWTEYDCSQFILKLKGVIPYELSIHILCIDRGNAVSKRLLVHEPDHFSVPNGGTNSSHVFAKIIP